MSMLIVGKHDKMGGMDYLPFYVFLRQKSYLTPRHIRNTMGAGLLRNMESFRYLGYRQFWRISVK